jgi:hypothetical protein
LRFFLRDKFAEDFFVAPSELLLLMVSKSQGVGLGCIVWPRWGFGENPGQRPGLNIFLLYARSNEFGKKPRPAAGAK